MRQHKCHRTPTGVSMDQHLFTTSKQSQVWLRQLEPWFDFRHLTALTSILLQSCSVR